MIIRRLSQLIRERLSHMPGVVLLGPRQIGKTTLARAIADDRGQTRFTLISRMKPIVPC